MKEKGEMMYAVLNTRGEIEYIARHKWQLDWIYQKGWGKVRLKVFFDKKTNAVTVVPHSYERILKLK